MIGQVIAHDAAGLRGVARRRQPSGDRPAAQSRREAVHRPRLHDAATRRTRRAAGRRCTACYGSTVQLADGRTVVADENYLRESIMNSQAKVVEGYQPDHAGVPGHGQRREPHAAHRLHQDAEAGAGRGCSETRVGAR